MGLFVEDSIPGLHLLYKTAVVVALAVVRWGVSYFRFNFNLKDMMSSASFFFFFTTCSNSSSTISHSQHNSSSSASASASASCSQMIRDSLLLTSFEDAKERLPWVSDTCAVCLCQLNPADHVRQLRNCCHVFHQDCIDRWVDYHQHHEDHDQDHDHDDHDDDHDNHNTCPLCRAPLLASAYQNHNNNQNQSFRYGYGYGYACSSPSPNPKNQPSWAVERLLYLFGDDLLP